VFVTTGLDIKHKQGTASNTMSAANLTILYTSDVNKDTSLKAKARTKDLTLEAKAKTKDSRFCP